MEEFRPMIMVKEMTARSFSFLLEQNGYFDTNESTEMYKRRGDEENRQEGHSPGLTHKLS